MDYGTPYALLRKQQIASTLGFQNLSMKNSVPYKPYETVSQSL